MTLPPALPIVEDFAAIHARLREIQATERPAAPAAGPEPRKAKDGAGQSVPAQYASFYGWLTGGVLQVPSGGG